MAGNSDQLFVDSALLQQAEELCRRKVEREPENRAALRSLAEVHRKRGNLEQAAEIYHRLRLLDPRDEEAGYLHALMSGTAWPQAPTGIHASPFVLLKGFLAREFHEALLPFLISVREQMTPIGDVPKASYAPDSRQALEFRGDWDRQRFRHAFMQKALPLLERLHLPSFKVGALEIVIRAYQDGHFFRVHQDATPDSPYAIRVINYVYFFHRMPRPYAGGDLLLFDSDIDANTYTKSRFTRIVPEDNAMIIFPCNFFHCVVPVRCASREFADSRFVINGHLRTRLEAVDGSARAHGLVAAEGQ